MDGWTVGGVRRCWSILSYFFPTPPLLTVPRRVAVSRSVALCRQRREGRDTHPAAAAAAAFLFFMSLPAAPVPPLHPPPLFPLRKFPICLCAGLVGRPGGVETAADAHADWGGALTHEGFWFFFSFFFSSLLFSFLLNAQACALPERARPRWHVQQIRCVRQSPPGGGG